MILISCKEKEVFEEDELFSFIENISESNIYKYELITLDEVMELNLKPSLEIRTGDVICKPFYPADKEKKGLELIELCFDRQKKELYLNELMDLTNTNIKFLTSNPIISSSIILVKSPIKEGNKLNSKRNSAFSYIKKVSRDKSKGEIEINLTYFEPSIHFEFLLNNKKSIVNIKFYLIDFKTSKYNLIRELKLKEIRKDDKKEIDN